MTASYDVATGRVKLPTVVGVSVACMWAVAFEMALATNQSTKQSWLAVDTIARRTGYGERQVQRARAALVESGTFQPLDTNHKSQAFKPGWRVSARKKIPKLVEGLTGTDRMLATLWVNGVRVTKDLARKTGLALRTVQKFVREKASPLSPVGKRPHGHPNKEPSSLRSSVQTSGRRYRSSREERISARQRRVIRLERIKKVMAPYDVFQDSDKYADSEELTSAIEKASRSKRKQDRRDKPQSEWGIQDVIREFRDRYQEKYPTHSPDELGDMKTLSILLGRARKDGVTIRHMIKSIDEFYRQKLDISDRKFPAWKKWIWCVRNTRPKTEGDFMREKLSSQVNPPKKAERPARWRPGQKSPVVHPPKEKLEARVRELSEKIEDLERGEAESEGYMRQALGDDRWVYTIRNMRDDLARFQKDLEEGRYT